MSGPLARLLFLTLYACSTMLSSILSTMRQMSWRVRGFLHRKKDRWVSEQWVFTPTSRNEEYHSRVLWQKVLTLGLSHTSKMRHPRLLESWQRSVEKDVDIVYYFPY